MVFLQLIGVHFLLQKLQILDQGLLPLSSVFLFYHHESHMLDIVQIYADEVH